MEAVDKTTQCYVLSLLHTMKSEKYITLWRPKNAGYTYYMEAAGVYDEIKPGYHDSHISVPIEKELFESLTIEASVLPLCKSVLEALGLKFSKKGIQRIGNYATFEPHP
jgi:hypothetical protein